MNTKSHKSNSLAEISTIFGMTLLLTLFGVFVYFMWTANKKSSEIKEQLSLDILFHESVDESIVRMMEKKLISMEGIVKKALFVSKDDAQKIMLKHVGKDAFEILDGVNPLPSSIHVNLSADYVNPDSASNFASKVLKGNEHIISEVSYNESQFLEIGIYNAIYSCCIINNSYFTNLQYHKIGCFFKKIYDSNHAISGSKILFY
jgi:cell division protein FtsX